MVHSVVLVDPANRLEALQRNWANDCNYFVLLGYRFIETRDHDYTMSGEYAMVKSAFYQPTML